jgi:hypothetical protein
MNYLALHDCEINHAEWNGCDLLIYFDWIDVLKSHPCNDTGKAMIAENSALRFENVKVLKSVIYDMQRAIDEMKRTGRKSCSANEADIIETDIIELCEDFLVLQVGLTFENGRYVWNCMGDNEFTIECDHIMVCWNDFNGSAWFEGWNDNKSIHVKRMVTHDTDKPGEQIEYPFPTNADIYNKIDEMNGITKRWVQLHLSEDKGETLYITCTDTDAFACMHTCSKKSLYLSEDVISDAESRLSYDESAPNSDIHISKAGVKGAVYRFYRHNGISECLKWRQSNARFWE